jgi:hypothetical protein
MMDDLKIILEINGQKMPADTYEVIKFLSGDEIKIKAVFHDQPDYCKEE